jgi:hypothetical protein
MSQTKLSSFGLDKRMAADFSGAHRRAFVNYVLALLSGRPNNLLPFDQVQRSSRLGEEVYLGLCNVEVSQIQGCVNRCQDWDRYFLPTQASLAERWKNINRAHYGLIQLPPPILLKVDPIYFVYDGYNRISVACLHGIDRIQAEVIEYAVRVPIKGHLRPEGLHILAEYTDFLERTNLDRLRRDQHIQFSFPGGYGILTQHIETCRHFLAQERGEPVSWEEAVTRWYDDTYMPGVRTIRERSMLPHFPDNTEADLYVWIIDHLHFLQERHGPDLGSETAIDDFMRRFSRRPASVLGRRVKQAVARVRRAIAKLSSPR